MMYMNLKSTESVKSDWNLRGYSFGVFRDPPRHIVASFVYRI